MTNVIALGWPGPVELLIILGIGLLIFGKRLPEVGRSIGKTIVEFKKGMREVESELHEIDDKPDTQKPRLDQQVQPRFDPYTGKPLTSETEARDQEQAPTNT